MKTPERIKNRDGQNKGPIKSTVNITEPEGKRGVLRMDSSELFISPTKHLSEILASCNFSAQKKEAAEEEAAKEWEKDIQKFRKDIDEKIASNEKSITNFNLKLTREKSQIDLLEQKNKILEKKLSEYQSQAKDSWTSFKSGFSYEMNLLEQELNHLIADSRK